MHIEVTKRNALTVVTLSGALDADSATELEKHTAELLRRGENAVAIVMNGVPYVCSAGLRVLLSVQRKLASSKGSFCLVGVTAQVSEVLDVTGLRTVLKIYSSLDDACAAL